MNLITNIDGHSFNLLNITQVYIAAHPEVPTHVHERKWATFGKVRIVTPEGFQGKIRLTGKNLDFPRDKDHEWFYGETQYHWWGSHTYHKFRWIPEKEFNEMPVWLVVVKFGDSLIRMKARPLEQAYALKADIIGMINQIEVGKCKYEPSKLSSQ
jgi:hypothetical protein